MGESRFFSNPNFLNYSNNSLFRKENIFLAESDEKKIDEIITHNTSIEFKLKKSYVESMMETGQSNVIQLTFYISHLFTQKSMEGSSLEISKSVYLYTKKSQILAATDKSDKTFGLLGRGGKPELIDNSAIFLKDYGSKGDFLVPMGLSKFNNSDLDYIEDNYVFKATFPKAYFEINEKDFEFYKNYFGLTINTEGDNIVVSYRGNKEKVYFPITATYTYNSFDGYYSHEYTIGAYELKYKKDFKYYDIVKKQYVSYPNKIEHRRKLKPDKFVWMNISIGDVQYNSRDKYTNSYRMNNYMYNLPIDKDREFNIVMPISQETELNDGTKGALVTGFYLTDINNIFEITDLNLGYYSPVNVKITKKDGSIVNLTDVNGSISLNTPDLVGNIKGVEARYVYPNNIPKSFSISANAKLINPNIRIANGEYNIFTAGLDVDKINNPNFSTKYRVNSKTAAIEVYGEDDLHNKKSTIPLVLTKDGKEISSMEESVSKNFVVNIGHLKQESLNSLDRIFARAQNIRARIVIPEDVELVKYEVADVPYMDMSKVKYEIEKTKYNKYSGRGGHTILTIWGAAGYGRYLGKLHLRMKKNIARENVSMSIETDYDRVPWRNKEFNIDESKKKIKNYGTKYLKFLYLVSGDTSYSLYVKEKDSDGEGRTSIDLPKGENEVTYTYRIETSSLKGSSDKKSLFAMIKVPENAKITSQLMPSEEIYDIKYSNEEAQKNFDKNTWDKYWNSGREYEEDNLDGIKTILVKLKDGSSISKGTVSTFSFNALVNSNENKVDNIVYSKDNLENESTNNTNEANINFKTRGIIEVNTKGVGKEKKPLSLGFKLYEVDENSSKEVNGYKVSKDSKSIYTKEGYGVITDLDETKTYILEQVTKEVNYLMPENKYVVITKDQFVGRTNSIYKYAKVDIENTFQREVIDVEMPINIQVGNDRHIYENSVRFLLESNTESIDYNKVAIGKYGKIVFKDVPINGTYTLKQISEIKNIDSVKDRQITIASDYTGKKIIESPIVFTNYTFSVRPILLFNQFKDKKVDEITETMGTIPKDVEILSNSIKGKLVGKEYVFKSVPIQREYELIPTDGESYKTRESKVKVNLLPIIKGEGFTPPYVAFVKKENAKVNHLITCKIQDQEGKAVNGSIAIYKKENSRVVKHL